MIPNPVILATLDALAALGIFGEKAISQMKRFLNGVVTHWGRMRKTIRARRTGEDALPKRNCSIILATFLGKKIRTWQKLHYLRA